jgi:hypothetical protein
MRRSKIFRIIRVATDSGVWFEIQIKKWFGWKLLGYHPFGDREVFLAHTFPTVEAAAEKIESIVNEMPETRSVIKLIR